MVMRIPGSRPHLRKFKPQVTAHWRGVLLCRADSSLWTSLFAHGFKCVVVGLDACDPAGRARAPGISQRPVSEVWIAIIFVDIPLGFDDELPDRSRRGCVPVPHSVAVSYDGCRRRRFTCASQPRRPCIVQTSFSLVLMGPGVSLL